MAKVVKSLVRKFNLNTKKPENNSVELSTTVYKDNISVSDENKLIVPPTPNNTANNSATVDCVTANDQHNISKEANKKSEQNAEFTLTLTEKLEELEKLKKMQELNEAENDKNQKRSESSLPSVDISTGEEVCSKNLGSSDSSYTES